MHFKAGGREVETIATDTVTQCSKNGKISVIQKSRTIPKKKITLIFLIFYSTMRHPYSIGFSIRHIILCIYISIIAASIAVAHFVFKK